jgi:hypothetical protein
MVQHSDASEIEAIIITPLELLDQSFALTGCGKTSADNVLRV